MPYRQGTDHRRSTRISNYDYALTGAYFITLVTFGRRLLFGATNVGGVELNELGTIVQQEWLRSPEIRAELDIDAFVVMPNHIHGIVFLQSERWGDRQVAPTVPRRFASSEGPGRRSLGSFVGGFKAATTTRINLLRKSPGAPVWQRNYYDRVIRNERELERARGYVLGNPGKWAEDKHNPDVSPLAQNPGVRATGR